MADNTIIITLAGMDDVGKKKKRQKAVPADLAPAGISASSSPFFSLSKRNKKKKRRNINPDSTTIASSQAPPNPNPSITISKADHNATLRLLKTMDWTMAKNTSRRNVIRTDDKDTPRNKMGKPYCMSFIFGRNMKDPTGSLSYWSQKYPQVYEKLQALMAKYDPSFHFTHITLNCNLRCKRHTDGGNAGPSYIAAFGDFQGGGLIVEQPGGGLPEQTLNCRSQFVKFNGKTQPHETSKFKGERFTLVYYTSDIVPPTVDRRRPATSKLAASSEAEDQNISSDFAEKFEAMKAKLGRKKRKR